MKGESIGILGGTFDPVHNGHLRFALEIRDALSLSSVRLIPLGRPPHRMPPLASDRMRLRMLAAAVRDEPRLMVDDQELRRNGFSYTVDTLDALRQRFPECALCLIMGADAFCQLNTWDRWRKILAFAHIIVAQRPGAPLPRKGEVAHLLDDWQTHDLARIREESAGRIFVHPVPQLDISATRIRALVARGASIRYLVPDAVLEIMTHEQLYV
uniref:Probable nicotinate-nucleotide adenylyltransferase n=1 Tax=Candidatus Kentrum sp. UNK TaxID=2126344 RepID=A0A451AR02_9GAMM|nr:MAG: nicotinate-nucleotide adenylyltransferase [Candidatus Kentron sp. UNK]VFK68481.1 MAG: nicotinate-nucleotide adenylyltransferase [Candidatus Kentron sp. UNK]